jgi:AraC family transcriptional regulator of adaptative response/methylated-DNA-[protein]-cysteine methyltransferase
MDGALERLRRRFGRGDVLAPIVPGDHPHLRRAADELRQYFAGGRTAFTIPFVLGGSAFERRAWEYLGAIPPGQTRTYGEQARAIGAGGGARAVGRANGMNYLSIVIPCHRVVGADGALTGYGGGLWRKRWLLDHERTVTGGRQPVETGLFPAPGRTARRGSLGVGGPA